MAAQFDRSSRAMIEAIRSELADRPASAFGGPAASALASKSITGGPLADLHRRHGNPGPVPPVRSLVVDADQVKALVGLIPDLIESQARLTDANNRLAAALELHNQMRGDEDTWPKPFDEDAG